MRSKTNIVKKSLSTEFSVSFSIIFPYLPVQDSSEIVQRRVLQPLTPGLSLQVYLRRAVSRASQACPGCLEGEEMHHPRVGGTFAGKFHGQILPSRS